MLSAYMTGETPIDALAPGLLIAAPRSGSGKSLLTLCLLAAYARRGVRVASAKVGPDYIDTEFHRAASGGVCVNLDAWAMRPRVLQELAAMASADADLLLAEGVMGLFDGARDGSGSSADVARMTGWSVVLLLDGRGTGHSVGAMVKGFAEFREDINLAGVLLNRVASPLHRRLLEEGCREAGVEVLGAFPEDSRLQLPHRHLGLVQAGEHPDLNRFLQLGAQLAEEHIDLERLQGLARHLPKTSAPKPHAPFAPPAQRIAVAKDIAFAFTYPSWFDAWRDAGAEVSFFSPLAGEAPCADAEFIFLPGGYPELHAGRLAAASNFLQGLRDAERRGGRIYGECGGYIVLGKGLQDEAGERHAFAGLLPLETRFQREHRTLGYRHARLLADGFLGAKQDIFRGHEFHFVAEQPHSKQAEAIFEVSPPVMEGETPAPRPSGMRAGKVAGSFLHLIDRAADERDANAPCPRKDRGNAPSNHAGGRRRR